MPSRAKPEHPNAGEHDAAIDQLLREGLEPDPARSRALVEAALASATERRQRPASAAIGDRRRWSAPRTVATAAAVTFAVLAALVWPRHASRQPTPAAGTPTVVAAAGGHTPQAGHESEKSIVSISNLDGPLTVTTRGGGRWIVLNGEGDTP